MVYLDARSGKFILLIISFVDEFSCWNFDGSVRVFGK
jgi:hypothetical protein